MTELLMKAAEQVPALFLFALALFGVVKLFLKHLAENREQIDQLSDACHKSHAEVIGTATKATERATNAIEENSKVIGAAQATMVEVCAVIRKCNQSNRK